MPASAPSVDTSTTSLGAPTEKLSEPPIGCPSSDTRRHTTTSVPSPTSSSRSTKSCEARTEADEATSAPVASNTLMPAGTPITDSLKLKVIRSGAVSSTAPCAGSVRTRVAWAAALPAGPTSNAQRTASRSNQPPARCAALRDVMGIIGVGVGGAGPPRPPGRPQPARRPHRT